MGGVCFFWNLAQSTCNNNKWNIIFLSSSIVTLALNCSIQHFSTSTHACMHQRMHDSFASSQNFSNCDKILFVLFYFVFVQMNDDMRKVVTLHGNCCVGQQKKLDDLRLCLNDWASYKALSTQQKLSDKRIALWRAPKRCKSRKRSKP